MRIDLRLEQRQFCAPQPDLLLSVLFDELVQPLDHMFKPVA